MVKSRTVCFERLFRFIATFNFESVLDFLCNKFAVLCHISNSCNSTFEVFLRVEYAINASIDWCNRTYNAAIKTEFASFYKLGDAFAKIT